MKIHHMVGIIITTIAFVGSQTIVQAAPSGNVGGGSVSVMTEAEWQELVDLQEYVWKKELQEQITATEKAMFEALNEVHAGASQAQKDAFDSMMKELGDHWSMDTNPGEFPPKNFDKLTAAQQRSVEGAYKDAVRNAAEEAEKQLKKVAEESTKKIGAGVQNGGTKTEVQLPPGDTKTVIKEPASGGTKTTIGQVIESEGSSAAGAGSKVGAGVTRKGLSAAAAKIAATAAGKTLLKIIPVLNTAAITIEIGSAVSDTLQDAVLTNIHAVDKLEQFLGALLRQEGALLNELRQLNAPEVLEAEQALAEAEALLPELESALGKNDPQVKDLKKKIEQGRKARDANEKKRKEIERQLKKIDELKKKIRKEIEEAEKKTGIIDVIVPVAVETVKGIPLTIKDFINWISSPFSTPSQNPPPIEVPRGPSIIVEIPPPIVNPDDVQLINMEIKALEGIRNRSKNKEDKKEAQDQIDDAKAMRKKVIEKQNKKYKEEQVKAKEKAKITRSDNTLIETVKPSDTKVLTTLTTPSSPSRTSGGGVVPVGGSVNPGMGTDVSCEMQNIKRMTNAGPLIVKDSKAPKGYRTIPGKNEPTIFAGETAVFKLYSLSPAVCTETNFTYHTSQSQFNLPKIGRKNPDPLQKDRLVVTTTKCQPGVKGLVHVSFDQTVTLTRGIQDGMVITKGTCVFNLDCGSPVSDEGGGKPSDYTVRPDSFVFTTGTTESVTGLSIFPQNFSADSNGQYTMIGFDRETWKKILNVQPFAIKFSTENGQTFTSTDIASGTIRTGDPLKKGDVISLTVLFRHTTVVALKKSLGITDGSTAINPLWVWGIGTSALPIQKTNQATRYVPFVGTDPNEERKVETGKQPLDTFTVKQEQDGTSTITAFLKPSLFGRVLNGIRLMAHLPEGNRTMTASKILFQSESGPSLIEQTSGKAEGVREVLKEEQMTITVKGVPAFESTWLTEGSFITFQAFNSRDPSVLPASKGIEWTGL